MTQPSKRVEELVEELKYGGEGIYAENSPHASTDFFDITDEVTKAITQLEQQVVRKTIQTILARVDDETRQDLESYTFIQQPLTPEDN